MILLSLLTAFNAHAAYAVSQYGAADITDVTSDYSYTCTAQPPSPSDRYQILNAGGTIVVITKSGILKLGVDSSRNGLFSPKGDDTGMVKKTYKEACDESGANLQAPIDEQLNTLFEVKNGSVKSKGCKCYVNEIRVIHDGDKVKSWDYTYKIVACP